MLESDALGHRVTINPDGSPFRSGDDIPAGQVTRIVPQIAVEKVGGASPWA